MASATENRFVNLYINGKQAGQSLNDIRSKHRQLTAEINRGKLTQSEYNKKILELRKYQGVLDQHRDAVKGVNKSWGMLKSVMMGVVGGNIILGLFQKITQFMPNLVSQNAKLADSFADVRKTTGLTESGIDSLNQRLKSIDTRTPRQRLLELARDAGKLGITGVANIASFVKAADQINVALGEDLGDGAITQIGKLNNLFKVSDLYGYEQGMLKIGSVINELGANSEASEGAIVDFISRLAGVAVQADISIEALGGYGATLDSLGQRTETSATAVSQAILGMFSDTEVYADIAGMSLQDFNKLLNEDSNEAFIKFLDGLNGNNDGLAAMAKRFEGLGIDGSRAITVLGALAGNTEKLREQQTLANQAFAEGSSLTTEFNIKNQNAAGNLEKIGRALNALWINSTLLSVIENVTSALADMIKIPVSTTLERQRIEFNGLMGAIMDTTTAEEDRLTIIKQLQESYGDRLGSMDIEKASLIELQGLLAKVNNEYLIEIVLMTQREKIEELQKRQGTAMGARSQNAVKANKQLTRSNEELGTSYGTVEEAINELEKTAIEKFDIDLKRMVQFNQEAIELKKLREARGDVYQQDVRAKQASRELQEEKQNELDLIAQLKEDYPELAAIMNRMNGATPAPAPDEPDPKTDGKIEETKRTLADLRAQLQGINDELKTASTRAEADAIKARAAIVQAQIDAIDPKEKDTARAAKAIEKEKEKWDKILEIINKAEQDVAIAGLEGKAQQEAQLQAKYDEMVSKADEHYDLMKTQAGTSQTELERLAQEHADNIMRIEKTRHAEGLQNDADFRKEREEKEKEVRDFLDAQINGGEDPEIAAIREKYAILREMAAENSELLAELKTAEGVALAAIEAENQREIRNIKLGLLAQGLDAAISITGDAETRKQRKLRESFDREIAMAEQTGADTTAIRARYNKMGADISEKNAKFEKAMALTILGINTAIALSYSIREAAKIPWPANIAAIASSIAAVLAFASQASSILTQAPEAPAFEDGTQNFQGGRARINETGKAGEIVTLPSGSSILPAGMSQQIFAANAFSRPTPQPNFSTINQGLTFGQGMQGNQSRVGGNGSGGGGMDMAPLLAKLDSLESAMNRVGDRKVLFVDKDHRDFLKRKDSNEKLVLMK